MNKVLIYHPSLRQRKKDNFNDKKKKKKPQKNPNNYPKTKSLKFITEVSVPVTDNHINMGLCIAIDTNRDQ